MSQVLIISKTRMRNGTCFGGLTIPSLKSVRLMDAGGGYHKRENEFEIGQLWEMDLKSPSTFVAPHNEDVLIQSKTFIKNVEAFSDIIDSTSLSKIVWKGSPDSIFQGCLSWTVKRNGYVQEKIPEMSTGFWIPDKDLVFDGDKHYIYDDGGKQWNSKYGFSYVGFVPPMPIIPAGTRVRVSLAKWWRPNDTPDMPERCYLQLSGWYNT